MFHLMYSVNEGNCQYRAKASSVEVAYAILAVWILIRLQYLYEYEKRLVVMASYSFAFRDDSVRGGEHLSAAMVGTETAVRVHLSGQ